MINIGKKKSSGSAIAQFSYHPTLLLYICTDFETNRFINMDTYMSLNLLNDYQDDGLCWLPSAFNTFLKDINHVRLV